MEPEIHPSLREEMPEAAQAEWPIAVAADSQLTPAPEEYRGLRWIFIGPLGLRAGWSVAIFIPLLVLFSAMLGTAFVKIHLIDPKAHFTAFAAFFGELIPFLGMVNAALLVALIERRKSLLDFTLAGPRRPLHFLSGLAAGFAALSALMGGLAWGGWLHFGPVALSGTEIFKFAGLWAAAFLLWASWRKASSAAICSSR